MDQANFSFTENNFLSGTTTVSKSGCEMKFLLMNGGKGEKFGVNLCEPLIHVDRFEAIDSSSYKRIPAGAAGCPAPLFGVDFEENAEELREFRTARDRVFVLFESIKSYYAADADRVNLSEIKKIGDGYGDTGPKVACAQHLLREYLRKCISFEAPQIESTKGGPRNTAPSNIPGVHPQTIISPPKQ